MNRDMLLKMILLGLIQVCLLSGLKADKAIKMSDHNYCTCDPVVDSLELVVFYNNFDGNNWINGWDLEMPMSTWYGVELDFDACVAKLTLNSNNLSGALYDMAFPQLIHLWLHDNNLSGSMPDFSNMPSLSLITLGQNRLTGNIPDFAHIPLLWSISIDDNQLTGTIPDFSNLPFIRSITLSKNELIGTIPDFSNLVNLKALVLDENHLVDPIPDFSNLPLLEYLHLNGNEFEASPFDFTNLPSLFSFKISNNHLDSFPPFSDPEITTVWMAGNKLTFEDILPHPLNVNDNFYAYWPQDSIYQEQTIYASLGSDLSIDLEIDASLNSNNYQWFKDGIIYGNPSNENKLVFTNIQPEDAGVYTCEVTNAGAPKLTLYSRPVTIIIQEGPLTIVDSILTAPLCLDDQNGQIDLSVEGGIPPYFYNWNTGAVTEDLYDLGLGVYTVTITDVSGSQVIHSFDFSTGLRLPIAMSEAFEFPLDESIITFNILTNELENYAEDDLLIRLLDMPDVLNDFTEDGKITLQLDETIHENTVIEIPYEICSAICPQSCDTAKAQISFAKGDLIIPNGFTPNGDGINDNFEIPILINSSEYPQNEILIFNRWGDVIFKASPYLNNWNGQSDNGRPLPMGTYYYRFTLSHGEGKTYTGDITILR